MDGIERSDVRGTEYSGSVEDSIVQSYEIHPGQDFAPSHDPVLAFGQ